MGRPSISVADVIRAHGDTLERVLGRPLTSAQQRVMHALASCRTSSLGGHLYRCTSCGEERIAYNSCRNRHCPSCLGSRSAAWLTARRDELLPVPYAHVVFTVPEEVAALALGNKRAVYNLLFAASSQTLLSIGRDPKHLGAQLGFLAVLHTWTQTLAHHPHVHCVVPAGGLAQAPDRWIATRARFFLPVQVLSCLFRGKLLAGLSRLRERGELQYGGATAELAAEPDWRRWLARHYRRDWVVYSKPPFGTPTQVLKYLARYTHRVAISNARLVSIDGDEVTFRYRDRTRADRTRTMTLSAVEFVRRFLLHVLPKRFVRIRHFGFLANGVRAARLAICRRLLGTPEIDPAGDLDSPPSDEAEHEDDPDTEADLRRCPGCGQTTLRFVVEVGPHDDPQWPTLEPRWLDSS